MTAAMREAAALLPCPFCGGDELSHGWSSPGMDGSASSGSVECYACDALIVGANEFDAIRKWNRRVLPVPQADDLICTKCKEVGEQAARIAEVMAEYNSCWRPCSGCQESVDGCVSTQDYPYNDTFKCQPGGGCPECGGLGVIWDDTDYEDMARFCLADENRPSEIVERVARAIAVADVPLPDEAAWADDDYLSFTGRENYRVQARAAIAALSALQRDQIEAEVDGWRPIETAPYDEAVDVRVEHMAFQAKLLAGHSLDENERACDQWVAIHDGEHPPCWTDGACWESNSNSETSLQPSAWRPLPAPPVRHPDAGGEPRNIDAPDGGEG